MVTSTGIFVHLLHVLYSFFSFSTADATVKQPVPIVVMIFAVVSHSAAVATDLREAMKKA